LSTIININLLYSIVILICNASNKVDLEENNLRIVYIEEIQLN
jgi:hypothetical protein